MSLAGHQAVLFLIDLTLLRVALWWAIYDHLRATGEIPAMAYWNPDGAEDRCSGS